MQCTDLRWSKSGTSAGSSFHFSTIPEGVNPRLINLPLALSPTPLLKKLLAAIELFMPYPGEDTGGIRAEDSIDIWRYVLDPALGDNHSLAVVEVEEIFSAAW
jgi:hypothetical protein